MTGNKNKGSSVSIKQSTKKPSISPEIISKPCPALSYDTISQYCQSLEALLN